LTAQTRTVPKKGNSGLNLLLIIVAATVGLAAAFVAVNYPRYRREMRAVEIRFLAGSQFLTIGHGEIEFAVQGGGKPVLVLHGAGGGYDQGLTLGKLALGDGYKLVSVSRYGYLRSPIPDHASNKTQALLYKDLLDHLNISRVIVLGGSAGAPSAIQFANDYPESASALILISGVTEAPVPDDKPPFYIAIIHLIQQSDYAYWLVAKFMQPAILNLMGISFEAYGRFTPFQKQIAQEMLDTMHPMTKRYPGTINDGEMIRREPLSTNKITAPTLILHARDDTLVSYHHAEHAHGVIKGSRLVLFDSGGHALLPQLAAVRQNVKDFLE
jgi:pimeloyl-ACP methyl ester carboxylesterase